MEIPRVECFPLFNDRRSLLLVVVDADKCLSGVGKSGLTGRELAVMGAIDHLRPLGSQGASGSSAS